MFLLFYFNWSIEGTNVQYVYMRLLISILVIVKQTDKQTKKGSGVTLK